MVFDVFILDIFTNLKHRSQWIVNDGSHPEGIIISAVAGRSVMNILKYLFPVPKDDTRRVITFANQDDYVSFRHHIYKKGSGKEIELTEIGPRFEMKLYQIKLGTLDQGDAADTEWVYKPYMNTTKKRKFLSDNEAFEKM